ncbi:uncharacterized protein TrAtP1_002086 [Trichoderma atroviride]|uniref:uncharacterized protein n=1 Tax=Hypocrea atroviridis TaxID=63577 RepID=UPI003332B8CE|nr:hypothetical protein TrAtP1_002086 [Trichoderma atroviride]
MEIEREKARSQLSLKRRTWRRGCGVSGQGIVGRLELDEESAQIDWRHRKDLTSRGSIENTRLAGKSSPGDRGCGKTGTQREKN